MSSVNVDKLLVAHVALPEPYQPAWGLQASRNVARRDCDDRLRILLPPIQAMPCRGALRIVDLGCAQGYFTLAIAHALAEQGRDFEIVGVDYVEDNIRFCEALAAHHGIAARFMHARIDGDFLDGLDIADWDIALAMNMLHHLHQQRVSTAGGVAAIRKHSRVAFCELAQREEALEWVDDWHAPDEQLLGEYAFRRRLASFATHLGAVRRPLYACSDTLAWVGERWFAFENVSERSHAGVPDTFAGQRRFFIGPDTVVKAYRGDGRYGAFNRAELEAEATTLATLPNEPGRYPVVMARADDGDMVWLARRLLHGRLLSRCIEAAEPFDPDALTTGLLGELACLEQRGFQHDDLRCWNVLVNDDGVRLIDFGAMTAKPSPLQRIALSAVLLEITTGKLRNQQPFYAALHPLERYPRAWHPLIRYLLETPQSAFRYARAREVFESTGRSKSLESDDTRLSPATEILTEVAHEQEESFRRLQEHLDASERYLIACQKENAEAAMERGSMEASRRESEAHATSLRKALEESRAFAESLREQSRREAADAETEKQALRDAQMAAATYSDSLRVALDESRAYSEALQARIESEAIAIAAERRALEESRRSSEEHARSLEQALAESRTFADSLQGQLEREAADAKAERQVLETSRREAEQHAKSLTKALAESRTFADSLQARLDREAADAMAERQALESALRESQGYAESLKKALEELKLYGDSLRARHEREAADAHRERAMLIARIEHWQASHARMQRRFRLLKFLWPREPRDSKDPE